MAHLDNCQPIILTLLSAECDARRLLEEGYQPVLCQSLERSAAGDYDNHEDDLRATSVKLGLY